jgi:hypothetical protein
MTVDTQAIARPLVAETVEESRARQERELHDAEELAARYGLEFVDVNHFRIDNDLFRRIPFDLMLRYSFIPERQLDGRLSVVMADPTDVVKIDEIELLLGQSIEVKVGVPSAIEEILQKSESAQRVLDEATEDFRIQLVSGGRRRRRGPVDRPHHAGHQPDHQAGRHDDLQRHPAPGERHPHRDPRHRGGDQVPHRRRPLPGDGADRQAPPPDHHQPHQGDGRARHRREARAAGRPLQAAAEGPHDRLPRLGHAHRLRRGLRHPHPRQGVDEQGVQDPDGSTSSASTPRPQASSASSSASPTAWCW